MATRFYLPSSGTPPLSSLSRYGDWTQPTGSSDPEVARLPMYTSKQDTTLTTSQNTWASATNPYWCWYQYQSEQLSSGYSFVHNAESFDLVVGKCAEETAGGNSYLAYVCYLVSSTGTYIALLDYGISASGGEFPVFGSDATRIRGDVTNDTVNASAGDRIILEIGLVGISPALVDARMDVGDPSGTSDFALTSGLTTDLCPWFEISADLSLGGAPDVTISGTITQGAQTSSGTLTVTDVDSRIDGTVTQGAQTSSGMLTVTDVDSRIDGTVTQGAQTSSGGLVVNDEVVIYGTLTQGAQRSRGALLIPITTAEIEPEPAGVDYELYVDGTDFPLIRAQVYRNATDESATVAVPAAVAETIAAATTLVLKMNRTALDGSGTTVSTLFTGTVDSASLSITRDIGRVSAAGAASWPTRQNRRISGSPSYIRDEAYSSTVRGKIDPDLVPGDVFRYGVRELYVSRVVFNLDRHYQFMEASNGY